LAIGGLVLALALAVFLGFFIPSTVRRNLLNSRTELIAHVADDLVGEGMIDASTGIPADLAELDAAVQLHLLGPDVLRVVLWNTSGMALYSDAPELIGRTAVSDEFSDALQGEPSVKTADSAESELGLLPAGHSAWEYYVPITGQGGAVIGVFEVYEDTESIDSTLASTRRMVWLSILFGVGLLFVFLLMLSRASLNALDGRRRQAERLVAEMARAQESERERIIGALHDEIGQPLYRVLYGIEGSLSQAEPGTPLADELGRASDLVRSVDSALRSELLMLHQGSIFDNDLDTLLQHLVEDVQSETRIEIALTTGQHLPLAEGPRAALFRATREAVTNVRKHSDAAKIEITVTEGSRRLIVDVQDDGGGFGGEEGLGISTTRERLEALGGGLQIVANDGGGTLFRAWVPIPAGVDPA
jgi:signal transduction histidine kinase